MPAQDRPVLFFSDEQSFRDCLLISHASVDVVWPPGPMHPIGHAEIDRAEADGRGDVAYGAKQKFADEQISG